MTIRECYKEIHDHLPPREQIIVEALLKEEEGWGAREVKETIGCDLDMDIEQVNRTMTKAFWRIGRRFLKAVQADTDNEEEEE